jgi:hypothetical protein
MAAFPADDCAQSQKGCGCMNVALAEDLSQCHAALRRTKVIAQERTQRS